MLPVLIYPVAEKSSDVYVKRQGYKLALFGWEGGGTFVVGPFFKNTPLHSDLRVTKLSDASIKLHFSGRGGHFSVSLNIIVTGYICK